jgi:CheY-like chemotaxis protein
MHALPEGCPMPETNRPRISVINDNPAFLELMAAILDDDAGYDVTLFDGASTSISQIAAAEPQLIVIDLLMGGASGWEIVALARADDRLASLPIIICSADVAALRDRAAELERIGNVHVLAKPFGIDQLSDLVAGLIGRPSPASR